VGGEITGFETPNCYIGQEKKGTSSCGVKELDEKNSRNVDSSHVEHSVAGDDKTIFIPGESGRFIETPKREEVRS